MIEEAGPEPPTPPPSGGEVSKAGICIPEKASKCSEYLFPSDSSMIDASKLSGCSNNGKVDCTSAIRSKLVAGSRTTIYFPPGTYLVSNTLEWGRDGSLGDKISFQGAGAEKSIIRLKDNSSGFNRSRTVLKLSYSPLLINREGLDKVTKHMRTFCRISQLLLVRVIQELSE